MLSDVQIEELAYETLATTATASYLDRQAAVIKAIQVAVRESQKPISVTDQLPEPNTPVLWWYVPKECWLVGCFYPDTIYCPPGHFEDTVFDGYVDRDEVSHWLPLPPPPKE